MMRHLLIGAGLSLSLGVAAQAQTPAPGEAAPGTVNPPASSTPAAPSTGAAVDTSATTSPYKTGMVIKDAQGSTVGTIARVIRTPDGATTISASVDGRNVNLPASALTPGADGGVVSSMSKAQITASTIPPT